MNQSELVDKIAADAGITKTQAEAAISSFTEAVAKTCKKDGKVIIVGFGSFSLTKRKARTGRNPQTGAALKIKASKTVKFSAGKTLKDSL
jgi:DNA-binding protein HU-beta